MLSIVGLKAVQLASPARVGMICGIQSTYRVGLRSFTTSQSLSAAKKKTKVKTQKELDKPKRPITAFSLYYKQKWEELNKDVKEQGLRVTEVMKQIAEKWNAEEETVKQRFVAQADTAKLQYDKDLAAWKEKYPTKLSGYTKFVKANFDKTVHSAAQGPSEIKRISALWRQLSQAEKDEWAKKQF